MKKRPDLLVGINVIATSILLVIAVLWVRQSDVAGRQQHVVAKFVDIGNARVGNNAVIRGVRAGRIERIELAADGGVLVSLSLERGIALPQDPVVLLNETSLFGDWEATITERSALPRDEAVQRQLEVAGETGVLRGATLPDIAKLSSVAGQIAGNVAQVAGRVQVAFNDSAARELRASIRNFEAMSATLNHQVYAHRNDLDSVSVVLQGAVQALNRAAQTTSVIAGRIDTSMTQGELRQLITDLRDAAAELKRTTSQISSMSTQLAGTQQRLDSFLTNGDAVLAKINSGQGTIGRLVNDSSVYVGSDSLLTELRQLVADVRANPKKYVSVRIF
jgi:phospholipid/cholesterol/gamma-HCH transport system substrate-binding protein